MPCPENQPGYKIQFKVHSITCNNEQAKVVIYCIPVLNAAISFPCYKVKETIGIDDTKQIYFSCLVLISQARLEHNSKNPLCSPIIWLFWGCFCHLIQKQLEKTSSRNYKISVLSQTISIQYTAIFNDKCFMQFFFHWELLQ